MNGYFLKRWNALLDFWGSLWFTPMDPVRLGLFRVLFGSTAFIYTLLRWENAHEWLTDAGYHSSTAARLYYEPWTAPVLPEGALLWFGIIMFSAIIGGIVGIGGRWADAVACLCFGYVKYADPLSSFTLNKFYLFVYFILALAPNVSFWDKKAQDRMIPAWPVRVIQATLVIQYSAAGWCKIFHGDWMQNPLVLWTQVQGVYCTDLAGWMLHHLPLWSWTAMQYSALSFEVLAPVLFLNKKLRPLGYFWGFGFQMVIAATMHQLIFFSAQMVTFYVLFMEPKHLRFFRDLLPFRR